MDEQSHAIPENNLYRNFQESLCEKTTNALCLNAYYEAISVTKASGRVQMLFICGIPLCVL